MADQQPSPSPPDATPRKPWRDLHLWQIQPVRDVLVVLVIVGFFWLGFKLSLVTVPLLLAILLAYLFEPIIAWLTKDERMGRSTAAGGLIVGAGLVVVVPIALGLTFGILQAVTSIGKVRADIELVYVSIQNPEDEEAAARVPEQWQGLIEWFRSEPDAASDPATDQPVDAIPADSTDQAVDGTGDEAAAEIRPPFKGPVAEPDSDAAQRQTLVQRLLEWVRGNADAITARAFQTGRDALSATAGALQGLGVLGFGAFLTAFFFFFVCTQWSSVIRFGDSLIPDDHREQAHHLIRQFDRVVAGFVRGRLTIAVIQAIIFAVLYWMIGTPAPVLFGILIGVLSIVPYLAIVGIPATILAMWLDPAGGFRGEWWWIVFAPMVVYYLGQAADDYLLTPSIQGKSTNLDTPTILFASLAGGILMGFYGLLIAIPLAACIKIALREVFWPRFKAWAEGEEADFLPIKRS